MNPLSFSRFRLFSFSALTVCLGLLLNASLAQAEDKPLVFVSVAPQQYLLQQVAGDRVDSVVLVQPGHNPHSYDPSARQMARLAKADMLMTTGVPFERTWVPRIRKLNPQLVLVDTLNTGVAEPEPVEDHHADHDHDHDVEHHGDHHAHSHDGLDPHIWMDPLQAQRQARIMMAALSDGWPEFRTEFERNYQQLAEQLDQLHHEIEHQLEDYKGRTFMVFHPAWGHFAERYQLEQVAIEYQGKAPSARQLVQLSEKARAENIKVILVQEQFNRKPAERIAANIDARVVGADPLPQDLPAAIRELSQQLLESWQ